MRAYAVEYEFSEQRHVAFRLTPCLFYAGKFRSAPDAVSHADLDADLDPQIDETDKTPEPVPVIPFPIRPIRDAAKYISTDQGNADYFVDLFGSQLRYDHSRQQWLVWRQHRWEPDLKGMVREAAQTAARRRLSEAMKLASTTVEETERRTKAILWAIRSESRASRESMLSTAKDRTGIAVRTTDDGWDMDPWLLGVPNGVVDLRSGALRPGQQEDKITMHAGVPYNPAASCPRWERFLDEIFQSDLGVVTFVRRAVGYMLSGDVSEDCWFAPTGEGRNGKTVFLNVLFDVMGDYAHSAPFSIVERGQGSRFSTAYLQHKRFVRASEVAEGALMDDAMLKKLTGRDPIEAEWKHGAEFKFLPTHKLWFMFNNKPGVKDSTYAFWRRVRIIPFNRTFTVADDDRDLPAALRREYPGILAWAVRACLEWQKYRLPVPPAILEASAQYRNDQDVLYEFLAQHVKQGVKAHGAKSFTLTQVHQLYQEWCQLVSIKHPYGRTNFGKMLESRGFQRLASTTGTRAYYGELIHMCTCMKPASQCACPGGKEP